MTITGVVARIRVDDLDAAVPFYESLTGAPARRFSFSGAELASIGPFLVFRAPGELGDRLEQVRATLAVDDLAAQERTLLEGGARIVAPRADTPNGQRMVVRHPDGAVLEYAGPQS